MGNANQKPGFSDLLKFITSETKNWATILHNVNNQPKRDFPLEGYIYQELIGTEERWSRIRQKGHINKSEAKEIKVQFEDKLNRQTYDMRRLSSNNERLKNRNQELEGRQSEMAKKIALLEKELKDRKQDTPGASSNHGIPNHDIKRKQHQDGTDEKMQHLQKQITKFEEENQVLQANVESLNMHVKFVEDEKDGLLLRLSKMAGDKLVDNNPAIADLSDPNRPTKLGEVYTEMYDNEWTSAFEKLQASGYDDETAIETLKLTLMNVLQFCETKAHKVLRQATGAVNLLYEEYKQSVIIKGVPAHLTMRRQRVRRRGNFEGEIKLQYRWKPKDPKMDAGNPNGNQMVKIPELEKIREGLQSTAESKLIQLRKEVAMSMVPIVQQAYIDASWSPECLHEMKDYIIKCLFLGWMMVVQSPPLTLASCEADDKFDKKMYKEYTKSGDTVDYVVLPALLLHENGAVVSKGVAQGKKG